MKQPRTHWRALPYQLAFRAPFSTAHGLQTARHGAILLARDGAGLEGLGDLVSLPEFGTPPLAEMIAVAVAWGQANGQLAPGDARQRLWADAAAHRLAGPVAAALDTALIDLETRQRGAPFGVALAGRGSPDTIPVNAVVGARDTAAAVAVARAAIAQGFGTIKLKVGLCADADAELARVAAVRATIGPSRRLRLDANETWTVTQAQRLLPQLAIFDLEYLEQPVPRADLAALRACRGLGVAIAADEACTDSDRAAAILRDEAADILILKPALLGPLTNTLHLADRALDRGFRVVTTSVIESGVGVTMALHCAAALPGNDLAHGLATSALLVADIIDPQLQITSGRLTVPRGPGLGVMLRREHMVHTAGGR